MATLWFKPWLRRRTLKGGVKPYVLGMRSSTTYQKIGCERLKTAFVFDLKLLINKSKSLKPTLSVQIVRAHV